MAFNIFEQTQSILRNAFGGGLLSAAQSTAQAARAVGEAKAVGFEKNAQLLRFDAEQYRSVGQDVFRNEVRQGLQRVGSAGSQYVAGGVTLTGSAGAVMSDIQRESQREATAQRNQYEFAARKSALQADIAQYQAGLERQAAEFQAQSVIQQAQANFEQAKSKYLLQNYDKYRDAQRQLGYLEASRNSAGPTIINFSKSYEDLNTVVGLFNSVADFQYR